MTAFFADLIEPDLPLDKAVQQYDAGALRTALTDVGAVANEIGLGGIWSRAEIMGFDWGPLRPMHALVGVSLAYACVVGAGFWREYQVRPVPPEPVNPAAPLSAAGSASTPVSQAALRSSEVEAIQRIVGASSGKGALPLRATLDVQASWMYDLEEGYRRRLAYMLGFEASIAHGSLAAYSERLETLIIGGFEKLDAIMPEPGTTEEFSICLNLLASLRGALAYEADRQTHHTALPGRVSSAERKQLFLEDRLHNAAQHRQESLHIDSRIAIQALMEEVDIIQRDGLHYNILPPLWGKIADSSVYQ